MDRQVSRQLDFFSDPAISREGGHAWSFWWVFVGVVFSCDWIHQSVDIYIYYIYMFKIYIYIICLLTMCRAFLIQNEKADMIRR